jgi:hypothetical protein
MNNFIRYSDIDAMSCIRTLPVSMSKYYFRAGGRRRSRIKVCINNYITRWYPVSACGSFSYYPGELGLYCSCAKYDLF